MNNKRHMSPPMSQEDLKRILHYDEDTGILTWVKPASTAVKVGTRAGCEKYNGNGEYKRRVINLKGNRYFEHHIIWFYMTGEWITETINHKDHNPCNNKWKNLEEISLQDNLSHRRRVGRIKQEPTNKSQFITVRKILHGKNKKSREIFWPIFVKKNFIES